MRKPEKLTELAKLIVYGFAFLITSYLTIVSCRYVVDITDMSLERDAVLPALLVLTAVSLVFWCTGRCVERLGKWGNHILFGLVLLAALSACAWWILNARSLPAGDGKSLYDIARRAMEHDLTTIAPTGSYMSLWPFQSGLLLYFEAILRIIPGADYLTIQWFNLFFTGLTLLSGYFTVRKWFASERTVTFWCLLTATCFPYFLYVNFIYGEIPSIGLIFFASWMLTEYVLRRKLVWAVIAAFAAAGAMALRKNSLIFIIAAVLVLGVMCMSERKNRRLLTGILLLALAALLGGSLPRHFYELRAGNTMGEGVPAVSYIAMGLQDSGGNTPGWWNGYHSKLYMECDYQAGPAAEISRSYIKERLAELAGSPAYALWFFHHKLATQWCDENFSCFYITMSLFEERTEAAWDVYTGKTNALLLKLMNWHQSVVYTGGFLFCLLAALRRRGRKKGNGSGQPEMRFWRLVWLTAVIGGFLFSIFWEGSSRYCLPYFILLLPYAADGLAETTDGAVKCAVNVIRKRKLRTEL